MASPSVSLCLILLGLSMLCGSAAGHPSAMSRFKRLHNGSNGKLDSANRNGNRRLNDFPPLPNVTYTMVPFDVPMSDGTILYSKLYRQTGAPARVAVLYEQVPYADLNMQQELLTMYILRLQLNCTSGLLFQTTRGEGNSTGSFNGFEMSSLDAHDTIEWIKNQPWSTGVVFSSGASAMGINSYLQSASDTWPTLRGGYAMWGSGSSYSATYQGGALRAILAYEWLMFLNGTQYMANVTAHESPVDPFWQTSTLNDVDFAQIRWPMVHEAGWYDLFQQSQLETFGKYQHDSHWQVRGSNMLIVDPLGHCNTGGGEVAFNQTAQYITLFVAFIASNKMFTLFGHANTAVAFDAALVEWRVLMKLLGFRIMWYVLGPGTEGARGHYLTAADDWPTPSIVSFYLTENQSLSTLPPVQPFNTSYVYDPTDPVPTYGGHGAFANDTNIYNVSACGAIDQLPLLSRKDVLTFTSNPFKQDTTVTGNVSVTLHVSSNCTDTDFIVKLVDVYPNSTRLLILEGIVRMRWRDMQLYPSPMVPDTVYEINVPLWSTSYIFNKGHSVGVDIQSSSYPEFSINPNTGKPLNSTTNDTLVALNSVHFGGLYKSALHLPVVDELPYWHMPTKLVGLMEELGRFLPFLS